jgi:hypothetical protein
MEIVKNPLQNASDNRVYTEVTKVFPINHNWQKRGDERDMIYFVESAKYNTEIIKCHYKKSTGGSEYWQFYGQNKNVFFRCADHWSYYVIPNYMVQNYPKIGESRIFSLKWGIKGEIRNGIHYSLNLLRERNKNIDNQTVINQIRDKQFDGGYVVMEPKTGDFLRQARLIGMVETSPSITLIESADYIDNILI